MQSLTSTAYPQTVNRFVFPNGIVLITIENQAADLIAGRIFLKNAGSGWESRAKAGLSHLVAAVLTKGTTNLSSVEIAEQVESVGASLSADTSADYFLLGLKTVAADFAPMLQLAGEILRSPSFPEAEVKLEKKLTIQSIRSQQEQPFNVAFNHLREAIYPEHPYGVSVLGTEATVSELTRADLLEYHQTYFRPDNLVISLAGRIDQQQAINLVESAFGDWQVPDHPLPQKTLISLNSNPSQQLIFQETQQSIIMLGYLVAAVTSKDYPVLKLISTYLGNGLSSRLFVELREKRGLAYDVSAFYPTRLDAAPFVAYMGTAPENTAIAIEGLRAEVERLSTNKLTDMEIQGAKNKLLGQYALGKQTNGEIAQIFGWYESLGLGIEFDSQFQQDVTQVTPETIQAVVDRYLDKPYLCVVGPNLNLDLN
ncbi:insulinase family protein [Pleurocapsales cyanobacterium LEGE 06147]|nr:insulinase family protein [Pleurocapsales cyanobacterium LEGE 06147]